MTILCCALAAPSQLAAQTDWPTVGNDQGRLRHSPLAEINCENVKDLTVAWTYHTGDADATLRTVIECTPVVVGGVMYLTTAAEKVVALDAATGRELWKFDTKVTPLARRYAKGGHWAEGINRGVAYWPGIRKGDSARIIVGTTDGRLVSLDARTGKPDAKFGEGGELDLRAGMERDLSRIAYGVTSAPAVFEDLIIVPFALGDGPSPAGPGDIRAFDVRTGRERWRFHTVPHPGEYGYESWRRAGSPDYWKVAGGVNPWGGLSVDVKRGWVFAATGSAAFDFYGGDRLGDNLFANCVLALDARTGRRIWHYQIVHHDLFDYDLPYPPILVTVKHAGRRREAVTQITKQGYVFVLDRVTGRPLFEVVERPAPASDVPGEQSAKTQPVPVKPPPFAQQGFTEADITNISPAAHDAVRAEFRKARAGALFTPLGLEPTVLMPGTLGGALWGGASFDPQSGLLYVNASNLANLMTLTPAPDGAGYRYRHKGYLRFRDPQGYPAGKPPWGTLTALDLNTGELAWQVPLGEYAELTVRGLPPTGTENMGGSIVTAGGLVFIAATKDEKIRAFDKATGKVLWEAKLPAAGYTAPCTYSAGGRQFVVIAAGGGGKMGTPSGDAFVAFALPAR